MSNIEKKVDLDSTITRKEGILSVDLDGEVGMMNVDKGKYYGMDTVGSRVWELIEKPQVLRKVIDTLLAEYNIDEKTCQEHVITFTSRLYNEDLISIA